MSENVMVKLAKRPHGPVADDDFTIERGTIEQPGEGEFLVRNHYLSLDPAMRGWMNEGRSYVPPVAIGEVMRAFAVGTVETSNHADFAEGDVVTGLFGAQQFAISNGRGVAKVDTDLAPMPTWLGGLGMPGMTAYFGLYKVANAGEGETVVVSAAAGAVGQVVGQLAKIRGCRAVGIAGGEKKCAMITDAFGFDAAVDYKAGKLAGDLKAACPEGIDVDFESVGGDVFDTVLGQMNPFGRVALCGLISMYNATELPPGPKNLRQVLVMRLKVQGFIVFDFADQYAEAVSALGGWYKAGKLKFHEDIREGGLEKFTDTLRLLYSGENLGKLILKL